MGSIKGQPHIIPYGNETLSAEQKDMQRRQIQKHIRPLLPVLRRLKLNMNNSEIAADLKFPLWRVEDHVRRLKKWVARLQELAA